MNVSRCGLSLSQIRTLTYRNLQGTIHEGQPQGKEELIHGLNTYVVGNRTNPRAIIVVYSDVFGLLLPNNKLIADSYAKSGEYLVYLPDFFEGDPLGLKVADLLIPVNEATQSRFAKCESCSCSIFFFETISLHFVNIGLHSAAPRRFSPS